MKFDQDAIMDMERRAFEVLTSNEVEERVRIKDPNKKDGWIIQVETSYNQHYVAPKLCSSIAMLVQELPFINTTQTFTFDFSQNGPQQVPGINNNVVINKNDVFAVVAIQLLLATGTNSASFIYRSHGVLPADDSIYNSNISMKTESSTYIDKMQGQYFRDNPGNATEYWGLTGAQIINPVRIISGELGRFQVILNLLNPIAGLIISDNTMISMRLIGVYGQAQG